MNVFATLCDGEEVVKHNAIAAVHSVINRRLAKSFITHNRTISKRSEQSPDLFKAPIPSALFPRRDNLTRHS